MSCKKNKLWSNAQKDAKVKNQENSLSLKLFISVLISLLFYDEITSAQFFSAKIKTQDSGYRPSILNARMAILMEVMAQKLFVVVEQLCEGKG